MCEPSVSSANTVHNNVTIYTKVDDMTLYLPYIIYTQSIGGGVELGGGRVHQIWERENVRSLTDYSQQIGSTAEKI